LNHNQRVAGAMNQFTYRRRWLAGARLAFDATPEGGTRM
jgi:hypothetical protein